MSPRGPWSPGQGSPGGLGLLCRARGGVRPFAGKSLLGQQHLWELRTCKLILLESSCPRTPGQLPPPEPVQRSLNTSVLTGPSLESGSAQCGLGPGASNSSRYRLVFSPSSITTHLLGTGAPKPAMGSGGLHLSPGPASGRQSPAWRRGEMESRKDGEDRASPQTCKGRVRGSPAGCCPSPLFWKAPGTSFP